MTGWYCSSIFRYQLWCHVGLEVSFEYRTSKSRLGAREMALPFCSFLYTLHLLTTILSLSGAQIFTALTHMTDLVRLEQSFSSILDEYLQYSTHVALNLDRFSNDVKQHLKDLKDENMEIFLGHPVNSYLLVRRFFHDWRNVVNKLDESNPIGKGN